MCHWLKSCGYICLGWKRCHSFGLWPRGTTVNSDSCTETLRSLNPSVFRDCCTRKMSEMLLNHNSARPYTDVCIMEAISDFGQTVLPHPPYNPSLAPSDYHLFDPLEIAC
jgi:hypothetical protein